MIDNFLKQRFSVIVSMVFLLTICSCFVSDVFSMANGNGDGLLIRTDKGWVKGALLDTGVKQYLGIPFAAPPVGDLRWKAPQPVASWKGILEAVTPPPAPVQIKSGNISGSEDSLYLNVWAPSKDALTGQKGHQNKLAPVIVFVFGGGFNNGNADYTFGPELAKRGIVFVTIQYRLGIFGGLALPELTAEGGHKKSGNYAHLDKIAALKWVQENIAKFGGNPDNVTLWGSSSSAIDACSLQASPLARGLFHRVVATSGAALPGGGAWPGWDLATAEQKGQTYMSSLNVSTVAELRMRTIQELLPKVKGLYYPAEEDGYFLPKSVRSIFEKGRQNDVPIMIGYARDEGFSNIYGTGFPFFPNPGPITSLAQFAPRLDAIFAGYPELEEQVKAMYPATNDAEAIAQALRIANDGEFGKQLVDWARLQDITGRNPAYLFRWSRGTLAKPFTAGHTGDKTYWAGLLPVGVTPLTDPVGVVLAEKMQDMMVAFANTGKPKTAEVNFWRPFNDRKPYMLRIGDAALLSDAASINMESVPVEKEKIYFFIEHGDEVVVGIGEQGMGLPF